MKCKWGIAMVVAVAMGICSAAWAESASVLLEKGIYTEETVGDLNGAIKIYQQIVNDTEANRPYVAEALYRLGICYHKKGQEQEARKALEKMIAQFPDQTDLVAKAEKYLPVRKVTDAEKIESESFSTEGWKLWQQRKLAEAEEMFERAVQLDPTNTNGWNGLGWSQFNQGKPLAAKVSFEKCVALEPKHAAALNGLGWIAKNEGKTEAAIAYWEKAIEAAPSATAALNGLATTYMELQQYEKAIKYYQKWLERDPQNRFAQAGLKKARAAVSGEVESAFDERELRRLIAELDNPNAPRFEALNLIIQMGKSAVPMLITEMKTNNNWQIPKALGAIGDERAIEPLMEKLEKCNWSPMKEVVAEALNRITGKDFGTDAKAWSSWWNKEGSKIHKQDIRGETQPEGGAVDESTLGKQRNAALARGDLIGACEAEMQRVLYRKRTGHAYKDKIGLANLYELELAQRLSHEQKEKYLQEMLTYLDQRRGQVEYEWRIYHLLCAIAADLGQKDKAADYLDKALLAYPEVSYSDPSNHSKFHHLVNQRSGMIWESDGAEAAEEYFLTQLKSNKKCEYFFASWWERQYETKGLNERLFPMLERVKGAYSIRMKAFPEKKALIERYLSSLNQSVSQILQEKKGRQPERKEVAATVSDKWFLAGSHRKDYVIEMDNRVTRNGKATAYIKAKDSASGLGFGTMMQTMPPAKYRSRRLRLSGYVKSENIRNWAGLWMRVDGPGRETLSFDNMNNRPIKGTANWKRYEIVLDVPEKSVNIAFGILLAGKGQVWVDDLQFEIVGNDVPTTSLK